MSEEENIVDKVQRLMDDMLCLVGNPTYEWRVVKKKDEFEDEKAYVLVVASKGDWSSTIAWCECHSTHDIFPEIIFCIPAMLEELKKRRDGNED